jgi:hypothetical protein
LVICITFQMAAFGVNAPAKVSAELQHVVATDRWNDERHATAACRKPKICA